jgi:hypothetical protein
MQKISRKVTISFRILGLSKDQIARFQKEVRSGREGFKVSKLRLDPSVSVVVLNLKSRQRYDDLLYFLKEHKIKKSSYGVWISLITNNDMGGVHVPTYVLRLYEKTGGNLDFSFVCG